MNNLVACRATNNQRRCVAWYRNFQKKWAVKGTLTPLWVVCYVPVNSELGTRMWGLHQTQLCSSSKLENQWDSLLDMLSDQVGCFWRCKLIIYSLHCICQRCGTSSVKKIVWNCVGGRLNCTAKEEKTTTLVLAFEVRVCDFSLLKLATFPLKSKI